LKKQSQFIGRQIGVISYIEGGYEDFVLWDEKKQTQFKANPSGMSCRTGVKLGKITNNK